MGAEQWEGWEVGLKTGLGDTELGGAGGQWESSSSWLWHKVGAGEQACVGR